MTTYRKMDPSEVPKGDSSGFRKMSREEVGEVTPFNVANEGGTTWDERLTFNKLATNPEAAKAFLKAKGYHVRPYGGGYNFAIQKSVDGQPPDDNGWKVVDPKGFDPFDLVEIAAEVPGAMAVGMGAAAGGLMGAPGLVPGVIAGGAAGAGLAGMAVEAGRQSLGRAAGVPQDYDPTQIATAGLVSGAGQWLASEIPGVSVGLQQGVEGAIKGARAGSKQLGKFAASVGAIASGKKSYEGLKAGDQLITEALAANTKTPLPTLREAVSNFRQWLPKARTSGFQESDEVADLLIKNRDKLIDIAPILNQISRHEPSELISEPKLLQNAIENIGRVETFLGLDLTRRGIKPTRLMVPVEKAQAIKQELQKIANYKNAYVDKPSEKELQFVGNLESAAKMIRRELQDKVKGRSASGKDIEELNDIMMRKSLVLDKLERKIGPGADETRAEIAAGGEAAGSEGYIKNLFADIKGGERENLAELDRLFGTNFTNYFRNAVVKTGVVEGPEAYRPRITATGLPLGMALGVGMAGGPARAAGGFAAGLLGAATLTPAGTVGLTRLILGADKVVAPWAKKLATAMTLGNLPMAQRAAAINAFNQGMARLIPNDRPVIREDAKRKELEGR